MDFVAMISEYETDGLSPEREVKFFQAMADDGLLFELQGFYQRRAQDLVNSGDLVISGETC